MVNDSASGVAQTYFTSFSGEHLPILQLDMRLARNTAESTDWDLRFSWHDYSIDDFAALANKFDVASLKPTDSRRRLISRKGCG
jgi:hypothetical protein